MSDNSKNANSTEQEPLSIRVKLVDDEKIDTIFSNDILAQFTADEFFITFAQIVPPNLLQNTREEILERGYHPSYAKVRIALPVRRMKQLIRILESNYSKYVAQHGDVTLDEEIEDSTLSDEEGSYNERGFSPSSK